MHSIFTIVKKELKRSFTDIRVLLGMILPGIIIFLINQGIGMIVCSIFLVILLASAIPTLINAITSKKTKYIAFASAFCLIGVIAMILEFIFL